MDLSKRIVLAGALALAWPLVAPAQDVRVEKGDCKTGVHLVARNARASSVLGQLSKELGFELKYEGDTDRLLDVDMTRRGPQLIAKLMESDNVIYDEVPDPKCPGKQKLAKVWVLPRGQEGPPPPRELTPMEMYRKAHGLPLEDDKDEPQRDEAR
jgi:hypothetical protein